jgi:NAD(P)-dependent dehydrogenase (short-subunit alcohol dehydrogenase family)
MTSLPPDSVVLVTGAAQGIGLATARAFASAGAHTVVVVDLDAARGTIVTDELRADAPGSFFVHADVADEQAVRSLFATVRERTGHLDFAVNNAGIEGELGPVEEQSAVSFDRLFGIDVRGLFFCLREEIALMKARRRGVIVNIASIAAHVGFPGSALYTAAKHAVLGLTRAAALETARHGVRICAVSPGAVDTDMTNRFTGRREETKRRMIEAIPLGRMCSPDEIGKGALWLCTDAAALMVGQTLNLDGGWANVKS